MAQAHKAAGLLAALEVHMMHNSASLLREVTMNDPLIMRQRAAIYRQMYPDGYYGQSRYYNSLDIEGLDVAAIDPQVLTATSYRRIDALVIDAMGKDGGYRRTAVEVKVTRADFFRDTEDKRRPWRDHTHRFYYLTPTGLVQPDEVPLGCGLWEADWYDTQAGERTYGVVTSRKRAVANAAPLDLYSEQFATYLAGRASRAEQALRQAQRELATAKESLREMNKQIWEQAR